MCPHVGAERCSHACHLDGGDAVFTGSGATDNGTGRIVRFGPGALPKTGPVLLRYLRQVALGWDYGSTTWHTNRDTYDKLVIDGLKSNATLVAMLTYLASEDPAMISRERLDPLSNEPRTGTVQAWAPCVKALRKSSEYQR